MRFTKMHGAGNDYIYLDCLRDPLPEHLPALARSISNRHTGIGADGLILILPSEHADVRMRMFNADGSEAEMCGNGIRCVAKYAYDHALARVNPMQIETAKGIQNLHLSIENGKVQQVRVNMGQPVFDHKQIPTALAGTPPLLEKLTLRKRAQSLLVSSISMGNPHCVIFTDQFETDDSQITDQLVHQLGPIIEKHPAFPNRVNVEFVHELSRTELQMRVWERGSGETQACGSGACAAVVIASLLERTGRVVDVHLPGGTLHIEWAEAGDVYLTGPAEEVFHGEMTQAAQNRLQRAA